MSLHMDCGDELSLEFAMDGWANNLVPERPLMFNAVGHEALQALLRAMPEEDRGLLEETQARINQRLTQALGIDSSRSTVHPLDPKDGLRWENEWASAGKEVAEFVRSKIAHMVILNTEESGQIGLQRLQWKIDRICERSSHPLGAAIRLNGLMMDSFYKLNDAWNTPVQVLRADLAAEQERKANVLPFRGRQ